MIKYELENLEELEKVLDKEIENYTKEIENDINTFEDEVKYIRKFLKKHKVQNFNEALLELCAFRDLWTIRQWKNIQYM